MLDYKNPQLIIETSKIKEGRITWRSPSNIAIIKYWGKHGLQLPRNPSLSFSLDAAYTEMSLFYQPKKGVDKGLELDFLFEGQPNEHFRLKIANFLESLTAIFPFLKQLRLRLESSNSFPHSAGIASSASSMSALALCLCSLEDDLFGTLSDDFAFRQKASFIARLGSGSACRSIYEKAAVWGTHSAVENSSDLYAVSFVEQLHPIFTSFHDDILIVSKGEKKVSSRAGHALMESNVFADSRYQQARIRFQELLNALQMGDLEVFGRIAESEALTLHALMMASNPPYILMQPNTLILIEKIQTYRKETTYPLYFSLDAGPNIHLLYPDDIAEKLQAFIEEELLPYCEDGLRILDRVGEGPLQL